MQILRHFPALYEVMGSVAVIATLEAIGERIWINFGFGNALAMLWRKAKKVR